MSVDLNHEQGLRELRERLHRVRTITPELMDDVIGAACLRLQGHGATVKAKIIRLLIESEAFVDATLALLELELPQWKLRRLINEDGEWYCALSKHLGLATELDDMAEANHENLPLAILSAFVEARHRSLTAVEGRPKSVPRVRPTQGYVICCDNFA
jgi:hypothetical protein